jgi:ADP-ribose pyrophosphatase YjhB (NUDIX family)
MRIGKRLFLKSAYPLLKVYWFLFRPKTEGVRCLITKGNKILLIQHSYGSSRWSVPGGGVKAKESLASAASREVFEEVGIKISSIKNLGHIFHDAEYKKDTVWIFHTEVMSDDFKIDELEIINAQWFSLNNLPENSSQHLRKFLSFYRKEKLEPRV